jgi:hypothetical protein
MWNPEMPLLLRKLMDLPLPRSPYTFFLFVLFSFLFGYTGAWTQGLMFTR